LESSVITCGTIKGGHGFNIIADSVEIVGTTRSFTRQAQDVIKRRMKCICCGVAETYGGEVDLNYEGKSPRIGHAYFGEINAYFCHGTERQQRTSRPLLTATPRTTRWWSERRPR
jgi:metal-dependent amidase/aminoacylase/carboxypeptidase family protein